MLISDQVSVDSNHPQVTKRPKPMTPDNFTDVLFAPLRLKVDATETGAGVKKAIEYALERKGCFTTYKTFSFLAKTTFSKGRGSKTCRRILLILKKNTLH